MGDVPDLLQQFMQRQQQADPQEIHRLRLLLDSADKQLQKVNTDREQYQIESAKGRVDFFDKLTIGAGATIAAIVSFLGAHSGKLQPSWIFRAALISLVLTMVASLYRNYRYPNYVLQIHKISWIRCSRYQQQCRLNCFRADPTAVSIQTGQPIDVPKTVEEFQKSDAELETILKDNEKLSERMNKEWVYSQFLSISFATLAMIFLAWLAFASF
jgi:hypothetical protein